MSTSWATFAFEAANFLLLVALLGYFFFRPVRALIEERRAALEGERREASDALRQVELERKQLLAERSSQQAELHDLREQRLRAAEDEKTAMLASARAQLEREREQLDLELGAARRAQLGAQARDGAFAARWIVGRLLELLNRPGLERELASSACRELARLHALGELGHVVLESAAPPSDELLSRVASAAGAEPEAIVTRVDPELIGGIRILCSRGLVDTTIAGLSARAEQLLAERLDAEPRDHG